MVGYTLGNVKELANAAEQFGLAPDLEARFGREALGCERIGFSYQRMAPGLRSSFGHRHRTQEEVYVVLSGGGRVKLDDEIRELVPWDAVRVSPVTMRAFEAGPDGLELLVFGASAIDVGDTETTPGWWAG